MCICMRYIYIYSDNIYRLYCKNGPVLQVICKYTSTMEHIWHMCICIYIYIYIYGPVFCWFVATPKQIGFFSVQQFIVEHYCSISFFMGLVIIQTISTGPWSHNPVSESQSFIGSNHVKFFEGRPA